MHDYYDAAFCSLWITCVHVRMHDCMYVMPGIDGDVIIIDVRDKFYTKLLFTLYLVTLHATAFRLLIDHHLFMTELA